MLDLLRARDRSTGSIRYLWLLWAIWLPYLVSPISALLSSHPSPPRLIITLMSVVAFVGVYLWTAWRFVAIRTFPAARAAATPVSQWFPVTALVALSLALSLGDGKDWLGLFIYTSATVGICLPLRKDSLVVSALVLLTAATGLIDHADLPAIGQTCFVIVITGFSVISLVWLIATNRALQVAREEIARLAVSEAGTRLRVSALHATCTTCWATASR